MHLGAVASMLFRHHTNKTLQDVLRRLDKDKLIGTLVFSDPATGNKNLPGEVNLKFFFFSSFREQNKR